VEYLLILNLFLYGNTPQAGMGGSSVATERFETIEQCEIVKKAFLSMKVTSEELKVNGRRAHVTVVRKAECVKLPSKQESQDVR